MRYAVWVVAAATIGAGVACSSGSGSDGPKAPSGFTFKSIADGGLASFGWTGALHDVTGPSGTPFGVKATKCDDPSGLCSFEGPTEPAGVVDRRRCLNRMSKTCKADEECASTPADPMHDKCVFIYDSPTSTPLQGLTADGKGPQLGACAWSYVPLKDLTGAPAIRGSLDLTTGALTLEQLDILLSLNGGGGHFRGICTECVGDPTPNDGKPEGTCMTSSRPGFAAEDSPDVGQHCDAHRRGTNDPRDATKDFGSAQYSMDCSPAVSPSDGLPTPFGGSFSSLGYQLSITADSPDCTDPEFAGEKCFCGVCPDLATPCHSKSDCDGQQCGNLPLSCAPNPAKNKKDGKPNTNSMGININNPSFPVGGCTNFDVPGTRSLIATRDNFCLNGMCTWDDNKGLGTCMSALSATTIACYPHGLGASISAPGFQLPQGATYLADTSTAACAFPSKDNAALNAQLGLPGLIFQRRRFQIIPEYNR